MKHVNKQLSTQSDLGKSRVLGQKRNDWKIVTAAIYQAAKGENGRLFGGRDVSNNKQTYV